MTTTYIFLASFLPAYTNSPAKSAVNNPSVSIRSIDVSAAGVARKISPQA
jgi:hypothetical protein